jgi:hypothetical protein
MKLAEILKPIRRGDPALILFDRHSAHLKTEAILKLVENDIEPVFVPPHMTHILQPLDNVPFAVFKKKLAAEKTKFVASAIFNRQMPTDVLQQTVVKAFTESFNEKVISRAWSDTGLSPFDENLIIQRAKQVCPPPEEEVTKSLDQASTPHEIMRAVQAVPGFHKPIQPKRKSVIKVKNKLYTGSDLLKYEEEQRAAAQEKEEQQKARQIELQAKKAILQQRREERMAEKERKKKEREEKVKAKRAKWCRVCAKYSRPNSRWWTCILCERFRVCDKHTENLHVILHHVERCCRDEEDSMGM